MGGGRAFTGTNVFIDYCLLTDIGSSLSPTGLYLIGVFALLSPPVTDSFLLYTACKVFCCRIIGCFFRLAYGVDSIY